MNSLKAPTRPAELDMPSRLEGLISLLVASPMALLGCTPDEPTGDTEGSSSGGSTGSGSSSGSTGVADSGSTSIGTSTGDDTTSTGSTGTTGGSSSTGPVDPSTSTGSSGESTTTDGESTSTGGGQGNTCQRVGDLMDMCFGGGYYSYYEYSCSYNINYWIAAGDLECAQAYNEVYSCIADLECAEVFMGVYQACEVEYDYMYSVCYDWGDTDTFGFETDTDGWSDSGWWGSGDTGVAFIVPPDTGGFGSATSGGWGGST